MRGPPLIALVLVAGALLGAYAAGLFDPPPAHIAALVPGDATYAIVMRSANDVRAAYEGPYMPQDADPARARLGAPVNVPGLDGIDYERPAGYYKRPGEPPVYLVPFTDRAAFEKAHATTRTNISMREPVRVAKRYLSLTEDNAVATIGPDDPWILEASGFPLALVGRPENGVALKAMLAAFFGQDPMPRVQNVTPIARTLLALPDAIADPVAQALDRIRIALRPREGAPGWVGFDLRGAPGARMERAFALAQEIDLGALVGRLPVNREMQMVFAAGAVLDADAWKQLGLPFEVGDAAGVVSVLNLKYRAGRFNVLVALRPTDPARLESWTLPGAAEERRLGEWMVRVHPAFVPPAPLDGLFGKPNESAPPRIAVTGSRGGIWYLALGPHAESVMREALQRAEGESAVSFGKLVAGQDRKTVPTRAHEKFFEPGAIALGFLDGDFAPAMRRPLPYIPMGSIGQPRAVTFRFEKRKGELRGDLRCFLAGVE
ncbi:MAG: hypothetical protein AAGD14_12030 [Planctomycetota bacterium]